MGYVNYNPNPENKIVGDCVIRAVSIALGLTWDDTHYDLCNLSGVMHDMPSSNNVWGEYVRLYGFKRHIIEDTCPNCYTIADFARDHRTGTFLVCTGTHVVAVVNGDYIDTWDSGNREEIQKEIRRIESDK